MRHFHFPYGNGEVEISLPGNVDARLLSPCRIDPAENPVHEIKRALQAPIGTNPLSEIAVHRENAVVVVSDRTRLAPTSLFLPWVIEEIVKGGISKGDILVVVAAGAHRKATEIEIEAIVGPEVYGTIRCLSSSPAAEECVNLGETSRGTPVQIFRSVAESDLIVATGNIEPHRLAAFSGGAKALVPGTSGFEAIEKNHALSTKGASKDPEQSEVRADAEEAAAMAGLDFIFNVVVDHQGRLIRAYAGHPVKAHREGCSLAGEVYYVELGLPVDVVIASAGGFPKDQNLYQAVKALQNAAAVVRPGGAVVLAASCHEGFGNETFQKWIEAGCSEAETLERFSRGFELGGHKAAYAAEITQKCEVHLTSELPGEVAELLHFHPHRNMQEAVETVLAGLKKDSPDVVVMPYAGLTFPG